MGHRITIVNSFNFQLRYNLSHLRVVSLEDINCGLSFWFNNFCGFCLSSIVSFITHQYLKELNNIMVVTLYKYRLCLNRQMWKERWGQKRRKMEQQERKHSNSLKRWAVSRYQKLLAASALKRGHHHEPQPAMSRNADQWVDANIERCTEWTVKHCILMFLLLLDGCSNRSGSFIYR